MKTKLLLQIGITFCIAFIGCNSEPEKQGTHKGADIKADSLVGNVIGMDTTWAYKNNGNCGYGAVVLSTESLTGKLDTLIVPLSGFSAMNLLNVMWNNGMIFSDLVFTIPRTAQCNIWPVRPHYITLQYTGISDGITNNGPEIYFE